MVTAGGLSSISRDSLHGLFVSLCMDLQYIAHSRPECEAFAPRSLASDEKRLDELIIVGKQQL